MPFLPASSSTSSATFVQAARLRPGSKECEVSKFSTALLLQLMFVCLLARLRAEPKHPLPMHNQTKLTVAVIAVSHNRSSGFLNERNAIRILLFPVIAARSVVAAGRRIQPAYRVP